MSGVNKVILIGRLGKDPEVKTIGNDSKVANFSIATSEKYKNNKGETVENTEWHNIVAWNKTAEIIQTYVKKGDQIYIEGKLKTRSWEKDGVTRYTTEIYVESMTMLSPKDSKSNGSNTAPQSNANSVPSNQTPKSTSQATTQANAADKDKLPWE